MYVGLFLLQALVLTSAYLPDTSDDSAAQDVQSPDTSSTLLTSDEPPPYKEQSPAVSILDIHPAPHLYPTKEPSPTPSPPVKDVDIQVTPTPQTVVSINPAENLPSSTSTSTSPEPRLSNLQTQIDHSDSRALLLHALSEAKHRYDALQRAFRDCSLTLKELKRTLGSPSSPSSSSGRTTNPSTTQHHHHMLLTALSRIDDFTEDARVELEIRIADEELTAHGFETLLSVPGALSGPDEHAETETNARRFADGTDEGVQKALERFERKVDDVQHDVAILKRTVHEASFAAAAAADSEDAGTDISSNSKSSAWTSWTAGLLTPTSSPSRSTTPAPTFGSVMTSPRLRHASSSKQLRGGPGTGGPSGASNGGGGDPLAALGFRIPMPSASLSPIQVPTTSSYPVGLGLGNAPGVGVRPRAISTIYSLGLGARSSSVGRLGTGVPSPSAGPSPTHSGSIPSTPVTSRFGSSPLSGRIGSSSAGPTQRGSVLINGGGHDERGGAVQDDEPGDVE